MMSAALLLLAFSTQSAEAQTAGDRAAADFVEVRNRFRLFREERDFLLHTDTGRGRSVLA